LDEEEEKFGLVLDDGDSDDSDEASEGRYEPSYQKNINQNSDAPPPSRPTKKHDEESTASSRRDDSPILKKASVPLRSISHFLDLLLPNSLILLSGKRTIRRRYVSSASVYLIAAHTLAAKPPPNINFAAQPMASVLKAGLQQTALRPAAPTLGYAAIAAGAVTQQAVSSPLPSTLAVQTPTSTVAPHPPLMTPSITTQLAISPQHASLEQQSTIATSPSLTQLSVTSPMLSSAASGSQQHDGSFYSGQDSPAVSEAKAVPQSPSVIKGLWFLIVLDTQLNLFCRFYLFACSCGASVNYGSYLIQFVIFLGTYGVT
jgi:CCR4-NOT transcription complex subunit 3